MPPDFNGIERVILTMASIKGHFVLFDPNKLYREYSLEETNTICGQPLFSGSSLNLLTTASPPVTSQKWNLLPFVLARFVHSQQSQRLVPGIHENTNRYFLFSVSIRRTKRSMAGQDSGYGYLTINGLHTFPQFE